MASNCLTIGNTPWALEIGEAKVDEEYQDSWTEYGGACLRHCAAMGFRVVSLLKFSADMLRKSWIDMNMC